MIFIIPYPFGIKKQICYNGVITLKKYTKICASAYAIFDTLVSRNDFLSIFLASYLFVDWRKDRNGDAFGKISHSMWNRYWKKN